MSSSFCSSCQIELKSDDNIREHYKSEFHRYNIKRKLVGLAPVTTDQFTTKKTQLLAESSQSERDQLYKCELCSKKFASKATYKQHLESRKHRENLKKFNRNERDIISEEDRRIEGKISNTALDQSVCLFCNHKSADIDENLLHMRLTHSFFISQWKNLKDLRGLLRYLGNKIHKKGMCISCGATSNKEVKSGEGVQRHMLDKGHIFMNEDDFEEYARFYDFSKVIEDLRRRNLTLENGDIIIEEEDYLEVDFRGNEEERSEGDDDDWEVIDGEEEGAARATKFRLKKAKLLDSGEIMLPNGQILGHRRYRHIYKQYYREAAKQNNLEENTSEYGDEKVLAAMQEENRLAAINQEIIRKERNFVQAQAHKLFVRREREELRLQMKANRIQHHFRRQLN